MDNAFVILLVYGFAKKKRWFNQIITYQKCIITTIAFNMDICNTDI